MNINRLRGPYGGWNPIFPIGAPKSIYIDSFSCFPVLISTYRWNEMHSRVALTIAYLPQASYLFKSKWYWHIRENIVFSPPQKTISTHRYLNETYPEANHSTYLSFEIPLRVALRLVIVPRGPEPTWKVTFKRHMGNIGFQPLLRPLNRSIFILFHVFQF